MPHFPKNKVVPIDMQVPDMALRILDRFAQITQADEICIGGGFARGLYMQQHMALSPQMNDIDIFANISAEQFSAVRWQLETVFGDPARFHVGTFEGEAAQRGLVEFVMPQSFGEQCAGVGSVQLNFGAAHPWGNPYRYLEQANVGINQIAITRKGNVIASTLFEGDMNKRTMTMNADREWSAFDWSKTAKALHRMQAERAEFKGWKSVLIPEPASQISGAFWTEKPGPRSTLAR